MSKIGYQDYTAVLRNWPEAAEKNFYHPQGEKDMTCYGPANSLNWAVQTNIKAFGAFAALALDPGIEAKLRKKYLEITLKLYRFIVRTHISGDRCCSDGLQWGCTWISVLGLERAMFAFEAFEGYLTADDKQRMRKLMESECDYLLDDYEIVAGITQNNRPESNTWNGCFLLRACLYYPDLPRRRECEEKGIKFLLNGISMPDDATSEQMFNGRMLKDWHVGANFTENCSLNHHGYLNVGYMAICLSNIAMLHFSYKKYAVEAPAALYHHAPELWKLVKNCTAPDGRLLRIGGDSRIRYCYCQDYMPLIWMFALDFFGDRDCIGFERNWLRTVKKEMEYAADGTFLSGRLAKMRRECPGYFTRLESDRAISMAYGVFFRRIFNLPSQVTEETGGTSSWADDFHCAALVRSERRFAAFAFEACGGPTAACLEPSRSDLMEYPFNMSGELITKGEAFNKQRFHGASCLFEGGFVCSGVSHWRNAKSEGEGESMADFARHCIACAALPDDRTMLFLQYADALRYVYLHDARALNLKIPNDLFNDFTRRYSFGGRELLCKSSPGCATVTDTCSDYLNVDGILGVHCLYGSDNLRILRPANRDQCLRSGTSLYGSLYSETVCSSSQAAPRYYLPSEVIIDCGFAVQTPVTAAETMDSAEANRRLKQLCNSGTMRSVTVRGADGREYLLLANFSQHPFALTPQNRRSAAGFSELNSDCRQVPEVLGPWFVSVFMR